MNASLTLPMLQIICSVCTLHGLLKTHSEPSHESKDGAFCKNG